MISLKTTSQIHFSLEGSFLVQTMRTEGEKDRKLQFRHKSQHQQARAGSALLCQAQLGLVGGTWIHHGFPRRCKQLQVFCPILYYPIKLQQSETRWVLYS